MLQNAAISVFTACSHEDYGRSALTLGGSEQARFVRPDRVGCGGSRLVQVLCPPYSAEQQRFARKQARRVFGLLPEYGSQIVEPSYLPAVSAEVYRRFMDDFLRSRERGFLPNIFLRRK